MLPHRSLPGTPLDRDEATAGATAGAQSAAERGADRWALVALLAGAVGIAFAPIFVRLSELEPTATVFHRLFLALPALWLWKALEARRLAERGRRDERPAGAASRRCPGAARGRPVLCRRPCPLALVDSLHHGRQRGLVTCGALLTAALLLGETLLPVTLKGWALLLALALVSQAGGQSLIAFALARLPAALSSVSLLLQPAVAGLLAWALLGEPLGPWQVAGALIILGGIYLARRGSGSFG